MTSHVVSGGLSDGGRPHDSIDYDSCRRRNAAAMRRGSDVHPVCQAAEEGDALQNPAGAVSCSGLDVDANTKLAFK